MKTAIEEFTLALIRAKAIKPSATKDFVKANTKALEMEKEQIIQAFENGELCTLFKNEDTSIKYYNKTFKK